jgi:hypothetical protein
MAVSFNLSIAGRVAGLRTPGTKNSLCLHLSKVEACAGLGFTQNPLPPTPSKRATSLDFHGEECGILAYKLNGGIKVSVAARILTSGKVKGV